MTFAIDRLNLVINQQLIRHSFKSPLVVSHVATGLPRSVAGTVLPHGGGEVRLMEPLDFDRRRSV